MAKKKGKGWWGDSKRHSEAAKKSRGKGLKKKPGLLKKQSFKHRVKTAVASNKKMRKITYGRDNWKKFSGREKRLLTSLMSNVKAN